MPMTYILIDCSLSRTFKWRNKDSLYHIQHFRIKCFLWQKICQEKSSEFSCETNVCLVNIHCHSIWLSLIFNNKWNKKLHFKDISHAWETVNLYVIGVLWIMNLTCHGTCVNKHVAERISIFDVIYHDKSNSLSIVHRWRTSWPFPRRDWCP